MTENKNRITEVSDTINNNQGYEEFFVRDHNQVEGGHVASETASNSIPRAIPERRVNTRPLPGKARGGQK